MEAWGATKSERLRENVEGENVKKKNGGDVFVFQRSLPWPEDHTALFFFTQQQIRRVVVKGC